LAASQEALEKHGIKLSAISYDSVKVIKGFAQKHRIAYPLLSDHGSKTIRAFGILNERDFKPASRAYGVPFPIVFLVDQTGIIRGKFAKRRYQNRPPIPELLAALEEHGKSKPPSPPAE
jgi:peroxiredoxin